MGRPRKWADDAERMRAKRAGSESPPLSEPELAVRRALDAAVADSEPSEQSEPAQNRRKTPAISEAEYIAAEVAATRVAIARGLQDHDGKRLDRARAYARMRYRGFLAGEVASL
jgi:hypothetical protein